MYKKVSVQWFGNIPQDHEKQLLEDGLGRACAMIKKDYVQGDLHSIVIDENDEEIEYEGWWELEE